MTALETPEVRLPACDLTGLKHAFDEVGYCIAAQCFSPEEVTEVRERFQDIDRLKAEATQGGFDAGQDFGEADDPLKRYPRYLHPHRDFDLARHYLLHPQLERILTGLLEQPPLAVQSMYYYKPPGARGQGMHQDNIYLLAEPHTCIAAWTAIDDCDRDNGGLMVVPRSHRKEILCDKFVPDENTFNRGSLPLPRGEKAVPTTMQAGDTLFFNGQLIHGSPPNRTTDRWRRAFIGHYVPEATTRLSKFYFPILDFQGQEVDCEINDSGGPCGGEWKGSVH